MIDIAFGTPEHIAGLSREALEADFRYVQDRRTELEEACERLQDENERLRSCLSDSAENAKQIMHEAYVQEAENAKLRELCATVIDDWMSKVCPTFPFCSCDGEYERCTDEACGNQIYRQMARELRIEVDDA